MEKYPLQITNTLHNSETVTSDKDAPTMWNSSFVPPVEDEEDETEQTTDDEKS